MFWPVCFPLWAGQSICAWCLCQILPKEELSLLTGGGVLPMWRYMDKSLTVYLNYLFWFLPTWNLSFERTEWVLHVLLQRVVVNKAASTWERTQPVCIISSFKQKRNSFQKSVLSCSSCRRMKSCVCCLCWGAVLQGLFCYSSVFGKSLQIVLWLIELLLYITKQWSHG